MKLQIKEYRNDWFEFYPNFGFNISYDFASYYHDVPQIHFHFIWGSFYINLINYKNVINKIFNKNIESYYEYNPPSYGVYYHSKAFWFKYGKDKVKCIRLPFYYDWIRTSYLKKDGTWGVDKSRKRFSDIFNYENQLWSEKYPYVYKLNNGEIQERIATVTVVEREWRMLFIKFTKLFNKIDKSIDINFDKEVGESFGSYKGGCYGCSYTMLKNETPEQTLRRMEKERIFK
jgi:hypothetical protein